MSLPHQTSWLSKGCWNQAKLTDTRVNGWETIFDGLMWTPHVCCSFWCARVTRRRERKRTSSKSVYSFFLVIIRDDYSKYDASMNKYHKLFQWSHKGASFVDFVVICFSACRTLVDELQNLLPLLAMEDLKSPDPWSKWSDVVVVCALVGMGCSEAFPFKDTYMSI